MSCVTGHLCGLLHTICSNITWLSSKVLYSALHAYSQRAYVYTEVTLVRLKLRLTTQHFGLGMGLVFLDLEHVSPDFGVDLGVSLDMGLEGFEIGFNFVLVGFDLGRATPDLGLIFLDLGSVCLDLRLGFGLVDLRLVSLDLGFHLRLADLDLEFGLGLTGLELELGLGVIES